MKISKYVVDCSRNPYNQNVIIARESNSHEWKPLVFLARPKWIKDNLAWEEICKSIQLTLKRDFEVK